MIPKEEQLYAIVHASDLELANKYTNGNHEKHESNWSITEDEFVDYGLTNGFPVGWVHTTNVTFDGIYILPNIEKWIVHVEERGKIYEDTRNQFESYENAIKYVVHVY